MANTAGKRTTYVAFLLGINIGPHKRVPMAGLRKMCEGMGFGSVRTVLASGNLIFDAPDQNPSGLARALEAQVKKTFGFEAGVIVRAADEIAKMIAADPFKGIRADSDTRFYVTFLGDPPKGKIAASSGRSEKGGSYRILGGSQGAVFGVFRIGKTGTTDAMSVLKKMFGKNITTRNWNTIEKLLPRTDPAAARPVTPRSRR